MIDPPRYSKLLDQNIQLLGTTLLTYLPINLPSSEYTYVLIGHQVAWIL